MSTRLRRSRDEAVFGRSLVLVLLAVYFTAISQSVADDTFVYAVQLSAVVQVAPPKITLSWEPDPFGAKSYSIFRKAEQDTSWGGPIATLDGSALNYTDTNVSVGDAYEYQIVKSATLGYTGYGYIYSGINAPLTESRGTLLLVVGRESVVGLDNELAQLQSDLIGDGWSLIRHDVSTNDTPESVRGLILGDYWNDPADVNTIFLLGHVPVLQSGYLNYDGHGSRPMPADAYYGDIYYDWPTTPGSSPSYLPSYVPFMIGRVDMADLPGIGAARPWPSETELLRNYLNKDHAWRNKLYSVQRRALMGNRRGDEAGLATAASGYRAFEPLVGAGNTVEANIADTAPAAQRWASMLSAGPYLWAYGCGAGQDTAVSYLGTNDAYQEVWSTDIVGHNAQGVFVMFFGSHLGNWDHQDNIMRSVLATPGIGLACFMSGEPHWFLHHMGLGETIGYSTRLSLNNTTLYKNQVNPFTNAVYIALMGDPTLRLDPVSPPAWAAATASAAGVTFTWGGSADAVMGYHVYRAPSPNGPYTRLTGSPLAGNSYLDTPSSGTYTYMVRAVALTTTPSGSYYNASEGVFASATAVGVAPPITVMVQADAAGITLSWNSQPGTNYHVEARSALGPPNWVNVSGPILATGPTSFWTDTGSGTSGSQFYRVASP